MFYFPSGCYVPRGIVYYLLKDSARVAGLPYQRRKRHSFFIGAASVAAAASLPAWLVKVSQPLVLGLLPAVYQNSSIYIRVCGSQDGYCSWTLPANLASVFSICFIRSLGWAWGDALPGMHQWRLSLRSDFPQACWAALPFNIACKPILLSDPARAVLHSARSAGEISEVLCSPILLSDPARAVLHSARSAGEISEVLCPCHRRKSHRLT